ncbi:alkaline-phosphatase-like protein [Mariannaea sp. PMI_226]|nr:alkaline-phosphatase-like protein [Mariannaea sp. PMI_226]
MFLAINPLCFSIIFFSLFLTKLVHLYVYADAISPFALAVYSPSLFLSDAVVICLSRLVLRRERGLVAIPIGVFGCFFSSILLAGASSQLGFFFKTGNEVEWQDTIGFAKDGEGRKVLLSGSGSVILSGLMILTPAYLAKSWLYRVVGEFLVGIGAPLVFLWRSMLRLRHSKGRNLSHYYAQIANTNPEFAGDSESEIYSDDEDDTERAMALVYGKGWTEPAGRTAQCFHETSYLACFTTAIFFLSMTMIFRPQQPYDIMATTLPSGMLEMFKSAPDMCAEQIQLDRNSFPFPDLVDASKWETPTGYSKGWAPGSHNKYVRKYRQNVPDWLPHPPPLGFSKWYPDNHADESPNGSSFGQDVMKQNRTQQASLCGLEGKDAFYNPVNDPLKITNLDSDIIGNVRDALSNGSVKIKHVALIMMESLREELFPLQMGSDMHKIIMSSHGQGKEDEVNTLLADMTPNFEKLTGIPGNWKKTDGSEIERSASELKDKTLPGFGGINVVGGLTPSSVSTKSLAALHCGLWPMAVDMFEEADLQPYQPCIPQILELFNQMKDDQNATEDFAEQQWYPAFFQSVTDQYDRQSKFDRKIGFQHVVTKKRLEIDDEDDELQKISYFGYAESALKPHIEKYIRNAQKRGRRMFLSHFTSTTHHPWTTPPDFNTSKYMNTDGGMSGHSNLNNYLNTIRWTDAWLGQLMNIFEDHGIANETLVVFVGDHGQAFKEDNFRTGTYENGHISNFRVPILLRHPHIPRIQYEANATSLSILPTILDLLIHSGSLNAKDTVAASDLIQDYEGQSLIRPYKTSYHGRRAWNFGIINAGGRALSVTSADAPWRLVLPLDNKSQYVFTNLERDPLEIARFSEWSMPALQVAIRDEFGDDSSRWAAEALAVARWWALERKRLWGYSLGDGRADESEEGSRDLGKP